MEKKEVLLMSCRSPYLDSEKTYPPLGMLYLKSAINDIANVTLSDDYNLKEPQFFDKYDFIGLSVMTPQREESLKILNTIKENYPNKKVIIGGPHAYHYQKEVEKLPYDYIVTRDGQRSLRNILLNGGERIQRDVMTKQEWANELKPDRISEESKRFLSSYTYNLEGRLAGTMLTATGCPEQCTFCFEENTKIVTENGTKKIKDIQINDKVLTFNNKNKKVELGKVKKCFKRKTNKYLIIKTKDFKTIKVTDKHPFYINGKWIKAKNLKVGDILHNITHSERMKILNPQFRKDVRKKTTKSLLDNTNFIPYLSTLEGRKKISDYMKVKAKNDNVMKRKEIVMKANSKENYENRRKNGFGIVKNKKNNIEKYLDNFIKKEFKGCFKFIGDKSKLICNHIPAFIHKKEKKIIELHGCYWHSCKKCKLKNNRNKDINIRDKKLYNKIRNEGWEILVLWEHDLKNNIALKQKIFNFITNGSEIVSINQMNEKINVYNFECDNNTYFAEGILVHNCEDAMTAVRWSPLEKLTQEMDDLLELGYKGVYLFDDLFAIAMPKVEPIAKELKKRDLIYRCNGQARYFTKWKDEFAKLLADTGCVEIAFGHETGSQKILDNIRKRTTVEQNYKSIEYAKKYGIKVKSFILLGLPGEDWETLKETEKFIATAGMDDFQLAVYYPYKGTQIRDAIDNNDTGFDLTFQGEGLGAYGQKGGNTEAVVRTKTLSEQDLLEFRNYLVDKYKPKSHKPHWFDTHLDGGSEYKNE